MRGVRGEKRRKDSKTYTKSQKTVRRKIERIGSSLLVSVQSDSFSYLSLSCSTRNSDSSVLSAVWLGTMLEACVHTHTECWSAGLTNIRSADCLVFVFLFQIWGYIRHNGSRDPVSFSLNIGVKTFDGCCLFLSDNQHNHPSSQAGRKKNKKTQVSFNSPPVVKRYTPADLFTCQFTCAECLRLNLGHKTSFFKNGGYGIYHH